MIPRNKSNTERKHHNNTQKCLPDKFIARPLADGNSERRIARPTMDSNTDNFIMRPTVDVCFKNLMENPKVRKGFIAALLGKKP